jgi:hypothetical protein
LLHRSYELGLRVPLCLLTDFESVTIFLQALCLSETSTMDGGRHPRNIASTSTPATPVRRHSQQILITPSMVKKHRKPRGSNAFHLPGPPPVLVLPGRRYFAQQTASNSNPRLDVPPPDPNDQDRPSFYDDVHFFSDPSAPMGGRKNSISGNAGQTK